MNSDLNPASKRLKTETNAGDKKGSRTDEMASSTSGGTETEVTISENVTNASANVFTEDILPEIFDNYRILKVNDLLNFRLVNRCWRDAATSVLLKRNNIDIELDIDKVALDEEDTSSVADSAEHINRIISYKYFNVRQPTTFLSDLNQLISSSPKFLSNSINFHRIKCTSGFGNLCPTPPVSADVDVGESQKDLLNFLTLHGKKMRRLTLGEGVSKKAAQNLLYVHMPHLISLDLLNFNCFSSRDQTKKDKKMQVCLPSPSTLQLREIHVGSTEPNLAKLEFVKGIIRSSPNLSAIYNIGTSTLGVLIEMGKSHLVQNLHFDLLYPTLDPILEGTLTSAPILQLSLLSIQFNDPSNDVVRSPNVLILKVLNLILSGCKNSLTHLFLDMNPTDSSNLANLFIPPLPHLQSLCMDYSENPSTQYHFQGDVIGRAVHAGELTASEFVDDFDALILRNQGSSKVNIPLNYFPRLRKVILFPRTTVEKHAEGDEALEFFTLERLGPDGNTKIPGDTLPAVKILELNEFPRGDGNVAKLFPNVTSLKILCESGNCERNRNWIWTAFPKLEKIVLYSHQNSWVGSMDTVDSFFTGMSKELCAQFESCATATELDSSLGPVLERTHAYIGDCHNLKKFKITFYEALSSKFASKVTAAHGFQQVIHRTKIILSFKCKEMSNEEIQETLWHLEPVADYVEIQRKKL